MMRYYKYATSEDELQAANGSSLIPRHTQNTGHSSGILIDKNTPKQLERSSIEYKAVISRSKEVSSSRERVSKAAGRRGIALCGQVGRGVVGYITKAEESRIRGCYNTGQSADKQANASKPNGYRVMHPLFGGCNRLQTWESSRYSTSAVDKESRG